MSIISKWNRVSISLAENRTLDNKKHHITLQDVIDIVSNLIKETNSHTVLKLFYSEVIDYLFKAYRMAKYQFSQDYT